MACDGCSGCSGGSCGGACGPGCGSKARAGTAGCPATQAFDWLGQMGIRQPRRTFDLVEVQFKGRRKELFKDITQDGVATGDWVIVQAERGGLDLGIVHLSGELVRLRARQQDPDGTHEHANLIRPAHPDEVDRLDRQRRDEGDALFDARQRAERHRLDMKMVDAEWQFDRAKLTLFFTAAQRVDFRSLVRELGAHHGCRVELRQIGARDEAARVGGLGVCGRELCCSTWLHEFKPVSTTAARAQNLPLNPTRLSGQCGRLKCCLNYELETYMRAVKGMPSAGTPVRTDYGAGRIQQVDIFRARVWVEYEDETWAEFTSDEIRAYIDKPQPRVRPPGGGPRGDRPRKPRR
jgi:cell fate regulator YaaT (PSP1 superfamily)